jgi:hypothetical protein
VTTVFVVPLELLHATEEALRLDGAERTAIWQMAEPPDVEKRVRRLVVPLQEPIVTALGHLVRVPSSEMARMQFEAYHAGLRTWIQIHTHPGNNVGMSDTDVAWAIADFPGALSIIVPNFGRDGLKSWTGVGVYERDDDGWREWTPGEPRTRLLVR